MNSYKLIIEYNGYNYIGWQVQPNGETIQGTLEDCLKKISKSEEVKTVGSGRTDSGVHAFGQVVKATINLKIDTKALEKALNSLLPDTIRVLSVEDCDASFHPIFSANKKEYLYAFTLPRKRNPFLGQLFARYPYDQFDEELLKKGCELFVGEHDFMNYFCTGTPTKTTVRKIFGCDMQHNKPHDIFAHMATDYYVLRFEGNGFLKQMVRLMVGSLWALSAGKISLQDIENSFQNKLENKLSPVAPAQGLYLHKVDYSN